MEADSPSGGQLPISLATPHHAPTWERHDPRALAAELSRLDKSIAELASVEDDGQRARRLELERQRVQIASRLEKLETGA